MYIEEVIVSSVNGVEILETGSCGLRSGEYIALSFFLFCTKKYADLTFVRKCSWALSDVEKRIPLVGWLALSRLESRVSNLKPPVPRGGLERVQETGLKDDEWTRGKVVRGRLIRARLPQDPRGFPNSKLLFLQFIHASYGLSHIVHQLLYAKHLQLCFFMILDLVTLPTISMQVVQTVALASNL